MKITLTPPSDQDRTCTCYATLGNRSTPPRAVYESLKIQEPTVQESIENTPDRTSSITRNVGFHESIDHETYVNANQINLAVGRPFLVGTRGYGVPGNENDESIVCMSVLY